MVSVTLFLKVTFCDVADKTSAYLWGTTQFCLGDSEGQGSLAGCSLWGRRNTILPLSNNNSIQFITISNPWLPQTCSVEFTGFVEWCQHITQFSKSECAGSPPLYPISNGHRPHLPLELRHCLFSMSSVHLPAHRWALGPTLSPLSAVLAGF